MELNVSRKAQYRPLDTESLAGLIADVQLNTGEIPWCEGGKTDNWDHIESAMGLSIGGFYAQARRAFEWSAAMQLSDGSWYSDYQSGVPLEKRRDVNMSTYVAVGLYHYYLITGDIAFLKSQWGMVSAAIEFALRLQHDSGEIFWSILPDGKIDRMALLTGSSSIYMSLKCALAIADRLGYQRPAWNEALLKLGNAIRYKPHCFNMTKSRYSMDWFYPILSGALTGIEAQKRINRFWKKFVVEGQGVRCVSDEPWITIAETSEFCLTLSAMGNTSVAGFIFNWISDKRFEDGSYWCGFTFPNMVIWPEEKMTWTNAVVLMAADALYQYTPACRLFDHRFWSR